MRITEFVYNLIDRFSPMQELDRTELRRDAQTDYLAARDKVFEPNSRKVREDVDVKTLPFKLKIIYWSEHWIVRTVLALLYIGCLRWVADWVNPSPEDEEPEYEVVD